MSEHHEQGHGLAYYRKIYFTLLGLLVISVVGPFFGILIVTLITAFGIAVVKANLVVQNFMHLKEEKRLMKWMLATSLLLMGLMFAGVSADVLNHEGRNWENLAAMAAVERGIDGAHAEGGEEEEAAVEVAFNVQSSYNIVCASCHGQAGDGTGPAGAALNPPTANFTDAEFWTTRDRDRIANVISVGAAAAFGGSPLMVGWGTSYTPEQIQEFTDYVLEFRPEE
jgi:caa(3)-type oxidase subunit IV